MTTDQSNTEPGGWTDPDEDDEPINSDLAFGSGWSRAASGLGFDSRPGDEDFRPIAKPKKKSRDAEVTIDPEETERRRLLGLETVLDRPGNALGRPGKGRKRGGVDSANNVRSVADELMLRAAREKLFMSGQFGDVDLDDIDSDEDLPANDGKAKKPASRRENPDWDERSGSRPTDDNDDDDSISDDVDDDDGDDEFAQPVVVHRENSSPRRPNISREKPAKAALKVPKPVKELPIKKEVVKAKVVKAKVVKAKVVKTKVVKTKVAKKKVVKAKVAKKKVVKAKVAKKKVVKAKVAKKKVVKAKVAKKKVIKAKVAKKKVVKAKVAKAKPGKKKAAAKKATPAKSQAKKKLMASASRSKSKPKGK